MDGLQRYARQFVLPEIGEEGQRRLLASTVVVIGCGALGTHIAGGLTRAGIGRLRIIDRDFVELNNLQRQILFDEGDAERSLPKAVAAAARLRRINSGIDIDPVVSDVNPSNIERLVDGANLVLDGTDNFEIRMLMNDICQKKEIPWVYGAVNGTGGMSLPIIPGKTGCFRCFLPETPAPGTTATCNTVGVLAASVSIVAAFEMTEGMKLLLGNEEAVQRRLFVFDLWDGSFDLLENAKGSAPCPACDLKRYEFLDAPEGSWITSLCGQDAVQINVSQDTCVDFPQLAERLARVGRVAFNDYMLRLNVDTYELNIFPNGRAIIKGCSDPGRARRMYAKYIAI